MGLLGWPICTLMVLMNLQGLTGHRTAKTLEIGGGPCDKDKYPYGGICRITCPEGVDFIDDYCTLYMATGTVHNPRDEDIDYTMFYDCDADGMYSTSQECLQLPWSQEEEVITEINSTRAVRHLLSWEEDFDNTTSYMHQDQPYPNYVGDKESGLSNDLSTYDKHHGPAKQLVLASTILSATNLLVLLAIILCILYGYCKKQTRITAANIPAQERQPLLAEMEDEDEVDDQQLVLPNDTEQQRGGQNAQGVQVFLPPNTGNGERQQCVGGAEEIPAIPVTDKHLAKLAKVMPEHWKTIGMEHFEITREDLDRFRTKHPYDRDMQIVEMFNVWVKANGKAVQLCDLCQKLNDAGIEWSVLHKLFSEGKTQPKVFG